MWRLLLDARQEQELAEVRNHAPEPYLRERAAGILKVAAGASAAAVARGGLLRARHPDTVRAWLERYRAEGKAGLLIRPGRGRKPAFSPPLPGRGGGEGGAAARRPPRPAPVRHRAESLDPGQDP